MKRFLLVFAISLVNAPPSWSEESALKPVISEILQSEATRLPRFPGVVAAEVESVLSFQTTGRVATRPVELGDRVEAGEILATLNQISLADDVAAARAALDAARAQSVLAEQNLSRAEQLTSSGIAAVSRLESAIAERDSSAAAVIAAEANLASAEDAERYGVLQAPSGGVVTKVSVEPGTVVAPGTPVVTLALDETLEVAVNVTPEMLAVLPADAGFVIRPRAEGAGPVAGRLRVIEPIADATTRSRRLRIRLEGKSPYLRIGSLVEVELSLPDTPVLSVPLTALRETDGPTLVWRIGGADRKAEAVPVVLGARIGDRIVVTEGLRPGDEILVRGVNSISEGQPLGKKAE